MFNPVSKKNGVVSPISQIFVEGVYRKYPSPPINDVWIYALGRQQVMKFKF